MSDNRQQRIWLKAFWGFDPANDGYLGFTRASDQSRLLREATRDDLVLIYGADSAETAETDRRQVLGFLQVELSPIRDVDALSAEGLRRKTDMGMKDRWTHAVPVLRAWEIQRKVEVGHIAQETYVAHRARVIASRGELMSAADVNRALALPVREISVFGRTPIADGGRHEAELSSILVPSKGLPPAFGTRESHYEDGDHFLYMLVGDGDGGAILGRPPSQMRGKSLVKIGFSNAPTRRCDEHNSALPPSSTFKWSLFLTSKPFADGASAKIAEDVLKASLATKVESLGGEFFLGSLETMRNAFFVVPGVGFHIYGAPPRLKR